MTDAAIKSCAEAMTAQWLTEAHKPETASQGLTLEQVKSLKGFETLYSLTHKNADGSRQRWRMNGKVRTWKRDASRVEIPVKHGLYSYGTIKTEDLRNFSLKDK